MTIASDADGAQHAPFRISVVMANYNREAFVARAVKSVLSQTGVGLELLFSDDGSTDASIAQALKAAAGNQRLVVLRNPHAGGAAATRNRAFANARGEWIAIVDSDDYLAPDRLSRMLETAERDGADIVADDLRLVVDGKQAGRLFAGRLAARASWVTPETFISLNHLYAQSPALGYVKPLFRRSLLAKLRYPYDETLPIAEDYDLLVRLLLAGARLRTIPYAGYYYRRHVGSTSHRLSGEAIRAMLAADARLSDAAPLSASITKALGRRRASIERAARFHEMASLAKRSRFGQLALAIVSAPRSALLFRVPLRDRTNKLVTAFSRFLG